MKIIADRKILLDAARTAAKAATVTNQSIPQLSGILFEAEISGTVKMTCTNLESSIQKRVKEIKVLDEGSAVIGAEMLCNMLRLLGGETVSIEVDNSLMCQIKSGNARYTIVTLPVDKFPKIAMPFPEDTIRIIGLPKLIRQTMFAAADTQNRNFALQGVHITFTSGNTSAAATDGTRIAIAQTEKCADGALDLILHQKSLSVLMGVIRPDDEMYVGISGKNVVMFKEGFIFMARLLENTFVDVGKVMSSIEKNYGAICESSVLLTSFDLISVCAKSSSDSYVHLVIENGCIRLKTSGEMGSTSHTAKATNTIPTPAEGFYYNPGLILDFLKFAEGEIDISINEKGFLLLNTGKYQYAVGPRQKPKPKEEKKPEAKKEKKPKSPKKPAEKAA